jgi:hypothetical protein
VRGGWLSRSVGPATPLLSPLLHPPFGVGGGSGIVRRVLAPHLPTALVLAALVVEVGPASRTAALFREQRREGRNRVDLPATGPAGESGHHILRDIAPTARRRVVRGTSGIHLSPMEITSDA